MVKSDVKSNAPEKSSIPTSNNITEEKRENLSDYEYSLILRTNLYNRIFGFFYAIIGLGLILIDLAVLGLFIAYYDTITKNIGLAEAMDGIVIIGILVFCFALIWFSGAVIIKKGVQGFITGLDQDEAHSPTHRAEDGIFMVINIIITPFEFLFVRLPKWLFSGFRANQKRKR